MNQKLHKFLSVDGMLKGHETQGELKSAKEYYSTFFKLALPSGIEALLVNMVAAIDLMMVGNLSTESVAAVGITNQPKFILIAVIFSLNVGVTAVIARRKGQGDIEGANRCLRQTVIISIVMSIAMAIIGYTFANEILYFAGANEDYIDIAIGYFEIIMLSIVFNGVSLTINAAQRGVGNMKISLYTNVTANLVNLVFNILLIHGIGIFPRLEVNGAGIATVIGSFVACVISIYSIIFKSEFLTLRGKTTWKFDKRTMDGILKISGSAGVEQVFVRIGFLLYAKIVANLGTIEFSTHQICLTILSTSFTLAEGFSIAASSLIGQSLGKKRVDEGYIYNSAGQRVCFLLSTVLFVIFILGRTFLVELYNDDPQVLAIGANIMIIIAFTTHLQTAQVMVTACLRGAGDTKFVAKVSLISVAIIRPSLTYILCYPVGMSIYGAWIAIFIDQIVRLSLNYRRFGTGEWSKVDI